MSDTVRAMAAWPGRRAPGPGMVLRGLLARPGALVLPGIYNAITARLAQDVGFEAVYATGAGISNSMLGLADVGLLSMKEVLEQVRYIVNAVEVPVVADADNGYGNAVNVYRTVREFEQAGVAGIQLEDQVTPKRCGHFSGKQVVPVGEMVANIHAAVDARQDSSLVLIARTDACEPLGIEEALSRAWQYAEAGADVTFVEAPRSVEDLRRVTDRLAGKAPQVVNLMEGGKTPVLELAELERMGFKIVLYANSALRAGLLGTRRVLEHLKQHGSTSGIADQIVSKAERDAITSLAALTEMDRRYASGQSGGTE